MALDDIILDDGISHKPKRRAKNGVSIENIDGNIMYVSNYESITTGREVERMVVNTNQPLTVGWAIGLCSTMLVAALGLAGGTYALIHSDVNEVRSSVDSVRDGASSDVSSLRTDVREDFNRVNDKLDAIANKIDSKIEANASRSDEKLDKLTEAINQMRREQSKP